jgi:hypothetical protein
LRSDIAALTLALVLFNPQRASSQADLTGTIPDCIGACIHFLNPKPGEMEMLAASGVRWVRVDFDWEGVEKVRAQYDFSTYDNLVTTLESYKISPYFILDYSNKLYDQGLSPYTEEGRRAFAQWASASVQHFQGRGIIWEMYNEPNFHFWRPKPNVHDYIMLALEVGEAIRTVAPHEVYVGPATDLIDFNFLEACFNAGLLNYWSAVSVHPYRQRDPESVAEEFRLLRNLIAAYTGKEKQVPIIAGEWGYSSTWNWKGMDEARQAKLLAREFLSNLANGVPLTIWYDWHDDTADSQDPESQFGLVRFPYLGAESRESRVENRKRAHDSRLPTGTPYVYQPKPAYLALRTLASVLYGYRFSKRLSVGSADDYVLLFVKGKDTRLAAWTTSSAERKVIIPVKGGRFSITDHQGRRLKPARAHAGKLAIMLTDAPQYLAPKHRNPIAPW